MIQKIKVLIVDDSKFFRTLIRTGLSSDNFIEVVGEASDAIEASEMIKSLKPNVMVLDFQMPKINGIDFLKELLPRNPLPVIIISSISGLVFDAIEAGAVDFVSKPDTAGPNNIENFIKDLIFKVKIASAARVGHKSKTQVTNTVKIEKTVEKPPVKKVSGSLHKNAYDIIAIGASTGGTEATSEILSKLPENSPGILIVQHMPPKFTKMYADRLNSSCKIYVKEAEDGDEVKVGTAFVAPGGFHMKLINKDGKYYVNIIEGEKVNGHCPSVDVLFDSVAAACGEKSIGIILTGMGSDGSKGLLNMKNKGAFTLGQDEKSSVVYGMPKVAWEIGAVAVQGNLEKIANTVNGKLL